VAAHVALWRFDLAQDPDQFFHLLDAVERQRAAALCDAATRRRLVVRRGLLRCLLANLVGGEPAAVPLSSDPMGRPFVVGADMNISTSSSRNLGLCAIAAGGGALGVDLERVRPLPDRAILSDICLAPNERASTDATFLRAWTAKEAVAKAVGVGLRLSPDRIAVMAGERLRRRGAVLGHPGHWRLAPVDVGAGALATLAVAEDL
jgi:4'-phosphopantetheinyl transferase